jgi:hypothetical protein
MKANIFSAALFALPAFGSASLLGAELHLGSPFSDPMVLHREKPVSIWGRAEAGDMVAVE